MKNKSLEIFLKKKEAAAPNMQELLQGSLLNLNILTNQCDTYIRSGCSPLDHNRSLRTTANKVTLGP